MKVVMPAAGRFVAKVIEPDEEYEARESKLLIPTRSSAADSRNVARVLRVGPGVPLSEGQLIIFDRYGKPTPVMVKLGSHEVTIFRLEDVIAYVEDAPAKPEPAGAEV